MPQLIEKFTRASIEGFVNEGDSKDKKESYVNLASVLISFIIALVLISLIGKLLWNGVITELFTCVRPAKSFMQILGLFVFISLIL
jgi:uncharacterized membrane protein